MERNPLWKEKFFPYDSIPKGSFTEANKIFDCCNFGNPYVLTNTSFPTQRIDVYASRNTWSAFLTTSSPLTVISFASPNPRPTRYNIFAYCRAQHTAAMLEFYAECCLG